jgi:hypothetical protein
MGHPLLSIETPPILSLINYSVLYHRPVLRTDDLSPLLVTEMPGRLTLRAQVIFLNLFIHIIYNLHSLFHRSQNLYGAVLESIEILKASNRTGKEETWLR